MPKTFTDGHPREYDRLARLMRQYHHELADNGARVSLTFVRAFDKEDEPVTALKFAGGTAYATVKLISQERKLRVPFDAEIKIDGFLWDELTERGKEALIDHELSHLKLQTDAHGEPLMDDADHVKLKMVPDDIILTGFLSVIRHFGRDATEYQSIHRAMQSAAEALTQMVGATEAVDLQPVEA